MSPPSIGATTDNNQTNNVAAAADDDELDLLLAEAAEDIKEIPTTSNQGVTTTNPIPRLINDNSFADAFTNSSKESTNFITQELSSKESNINDDIDSSDDENVKNFLEQKYNEYGREINQKIKNENAEKKEAEIAREVHMNITQKNYSLLQKNKSKTPDISADQNQTSMVARKKQTKLSRSFKSAGNTGNTEVTPLTSSLTKTEHTIFTDPIFGLRIIKPLISSSILTERMKGRKPISVASLKYHIENGDLTKDWVICGAIIHKSPIKTTKNGAGYSIWKLSDLKGDMKTFSMFLFKNAHKELWKTALGMFVAVLNPGVFDRQNERDSVACLTIDTINKVMVLGQSKDMGTCKAKKKNGENCTAIVNLADCDYCIYHVKNAFTKMSQRSELQSSTAGRGLQELRNKVLGKNEVFYAGQSYAAIPAKKNPKLIAKDNQRITTLSEYFHSPNAVNINHTASPKIPSSEIPYAVRSGGIKSKVACKVEVNTKQRLQDLERLRILKGELNPLSDSSEKSTNEFKTLSPSSIIPAKFHNREFSFAAAAGGVSGAAPKLNRESFSMDFSFNLRKAAIAKEKALEIVKKKPIEKSNPNLIKYRGTNLGKKRVMEELNEFYNNDSKRQKMNEERQEYERKSRLQKIIDAASSHQDLIEMRELDEQEKHFNKLEKKEAMEEKMLNTYEMPCKAVTCLQCKYTSFSAADHCKTAHHPFKIIDAAKRFFKCLDCGNRTVTLLKLPKTSCNTCKSSRWQRAGMIKDRKLLDPNANLSIRGDEQKFMGSNSNMSSASLNLLVPDES